jgi:hypothetical protein
MCIRLRPGRMDHSTDAPGARWPDLMVTVEWSGLDSAKIYLLLPWVQKSGCSCIQAASEQVAYIPGG